MKMRVVVMVLIVSVLVGPACAGSGGEPGESTADSVESAITIADFSFGDPITVSVGTTVRVSNEDSVPHTWTAVDDGFDSGPIDPGSDFDFTFTEPGQYQFHCTIHPSMEGSIEVTQS